MAERESFELASVGELKVEDSIKDVVTTAQPKKDDEDNGEVRVAAKTIQMLTRSKLKQRLAANELAMVCVDGFGGEHFSHSGGVNLEVPRSLQTALYGSESEEWRKAIDEELQALEEAEVLSSPVELPKK
jgi:hypothetical protein